MKKILFLDRDGTLIVEPPGDWQIDRFEKLEFLPKVIQNLADILQKTDYELVMITNQDGLGTESYPEDSFWGPHHLMMKILETEGIEFKEVLIDITYQKDEADTRKPFTGLLRHYMDGSVDMANSYVVGDRLTDMQLAINLGCQGIMIGKSEDATDDGMCELDKMPAAIALDANNWDEIRDFLLTQS